MGVTSKGSGDRRGCHGEGLKVGALALARAGRRISLVNGSEGWRVSLEFSRVFSDRQVLTVYTRKLAADSGGFGAKIQLSPGEWAEYKRAFLDLDPSISRLATKETELLLDEDQRGRLYVKGILVEERSGLAFGYNFLSVSTDRDRRMIGSFDFDWYISRCWIEALEQGGVGPDEMLEFLHGDTADARGFNSVHVPQSAHEAVARSWHAAYGDGIIPVQIEAQLNEAEHIGRVGRVAPGPVYAFFSGYEPLSLDLLKQSSRARVLREHRSDDLSDQELNHLASAITVIEPQLKPLGIDSIHHRLHVVDFRTPMCWVCTLPAKGARASTSAARFLPTPCARPSRCWCTRSPTTEAAMALLPMSALKALCSPPSWPTWPPTSSSFTARQPNSLRQPLHDQSLRLPTPGRTELHQLPLPPPSPRRVHLCHSRTRSDRRWNDAAALGLQLVRRVGPGRAAAMNRTIKPSHGTPNHL
jgi:hypothetical protein